MRKQQQENTKAFQRRPFGDAARDIIKTTETSNFKIESQP